jgi:hypothetical protein
MRVAVAALVQTLVALEELVAVALVLKIVLLWLQ